MATRITTRAARRPLLLVAASCLLIALAASCRPSDDRAAGDGARTEGGVSISLQAIGRTSMNGFPVEVLVSRDGETVSQADVVIVGEMTHAGMPRLMWSAPEVEPGRYRLERFEPSMPGDWIVTAEVSLPGAYKVTTELFLTLSN